MLVGTCMALSRVRTSEMVGDDSPALFSVPSSVPSVTLSAPSCFPTASTLALATPHSASTARTVEGGTVVEESVPVALGASPCE
jgi:hypothetical protein